MSINSTYIFISFIIGFLIVGYLRSFDLHEKEPMIKMSIVTFWGGAWSIVISLILYGGLHTFGLHSHRNLFGAFFIIGPVEELAKFLALLSSYFLIKDELNEPTDGLVYMACVALGFSLIENYFYAVRTPHSGYLLLYRLVLSTPLHIFASIFMGLAFYTIVKLRRGLLLFLVAFAYAVIVHGLYDGIIFQSWLFVFLLVVLRVSYHWALALLSYTTAKSPFRPSLSQFVRKLDNQSIERGMECLHCGNKDSKATSRLGRITIQKCHECGGYVLSRKSLFLIFHHFGSDFRNLTRHYKSKDVYKTAYSTLFSGNQVADGKDLAYFRLDELDTALKEFNDGVIHDIEQKWWFSKGLVIG